MRRTLLVALMLGSWATVPAKGQQPLPPFRFGTHVAGNMMNGPFDMYRVGAQAVIPVGPRLAFYPAVSRFLDGAEWEVSAALRYRPLGARDGSSPLYLGVGFAGINWGHEGRGYDLLITGLELPNGRLMSRALDNRLGAYVALEAARRVAEAGDTQVDVVAVAAVQEEIGLFGARAAAFGLDPQVAIAIDVTPSTDYPGGDPRRAGRIEIGAGAMIARGPTLNKRIVDLLVEAADAEGIPHAFEVYTRTTSTDADELHLARAGVPTGLISVPTRYVHSPNELCALEDVEAAVKLVAAFARRLAPQLSFER